MDSIQPYRTKPFDVKAIRVTADNLDVAAEWCHGVIITQKSYAEALLSETDGAKIHVYGQLGYSTGVAQVDDYIVLDTDDVFRVYSKHDFKQKYDLLEDQVIIPGAGGGYVATVPVELEDTVEKTFNGNQD